MDVRFLRIVGRTQYAGSQLTKAGVAPRRLDDRCVWRYECDGQGKPPGAKVP